MAIRNRARQDRRNLSRVIVRLDCQFTHEGVTHKAVMVDLSLKGALFFRCLLAAEWFNHHCYAELAGHPKSARL